jgi:hypothetical protein
MQGCIAYYRLASPLIGRMLEGIIAVAVDGLPRYQPPRSFSCMPTTAAWSFRRLKNSC